MTLREVALSLHTLEKSVLQLPESHMRQALNVHIQAMLELLLAERLQDNEARNFQLTEPSAPTPKKSRRTKA